MNLTTKLLIYFGLTLTVFVAPNISLAQLSEVDPSGVSACADLKNNLGYGSRDQGSSNDIFILQDFLNAAGYLTAQPTGFFGKLTLAAVKAFQRTTGISNTGYVGPITRAKIKAIDCAGTINTTNTTNTTNTSSFPSVTIVYPNSGGSLFKGGNFSIEWKTSNVPSSNQMVVYLRNSVSNIEYSLVNSTNDGYERFVLPSSIPIGTYALEIKTTVGNQSYKDFSDVYFRVIDKTTTTNNTTNITNTTNTTTAIKPLITILYPNSGGSLFKGGNFSIEWKTSNVPNYNQMSVYLRNFSTNVEYSVTTSINDGYEKFILPSSVPAGTYALEIKTTVDGQTYKDAGDVNFNIIDQTTFTNATNPVFPTVKIMSPQIGESFRVGDNIPIFFSVTDAPANSQISYSIVGVNTSGGVISGTGQSGKSSRLSTGVSVSSISYKTGGTSGVNTSGTYEISATVNECNLSGCDAMPLGKSLSLVSNKIRITVNPAVVTSSEIPVLSFTATPTSNNTPFIIKLNGPQEFLTKANSCKYSFGFFGTSGVGLEVDWGDGIKSPQFSFSKLGQSCSNEVLTHTYASSGIYSIRVEGWHPGSTDIPMTDWTGGARVLVAGSPESFLPVVEVIGTPTLGLTYDAEGRESTLTGTAKIKVSSGASAITFYRNRNADLILVGSTSQRTNSYKTSIVGGDIYLPILLNAGTSITYDVDISVNANELVAGDYYLTTGDIYDAVTNTKITTTFKGIKESGRVNVLGKSFVSLPALTLTADKVSVNAGESYKLNWTATNTNALASSPCTLKNNNVSIPFLSLNSFAAISPTVAGTITSVLECVGPGGKASKTATVTVTPSVELILGASENPATYDKPITISWSSPANASACSLKGGNPLVLNTQPSGSFLIALTATSSFRLSCTVNSLEVVKVITVGVTGIPVVKTLTKVATSPTTSTLSWTSTNATNCALTYPNGNTVSALLANSSRSVTALGSYSLKCGSINGTSTAKTISVTAHAQIAPTISVQVNPDPIYEIVPGTNVNISWQSTNATSCTIFDSGRNVTDTMPVSGSKTYNPLTPTDFLIKCTGAGGSAQKTVHTIFYVPPPTDF